MKRIAYSITLGTLAMILSANVAVAQGTQTVKASDEYQKQKEAELQKKQKALTEEEQKKAQMAEQEAKKKVITEQEIKEKIAQIEAEAAEREYDLRKNLEYNRSLRDYEDIRRRAEDLSKSFPMVVIPENKVYKYVMPDIGDYYIYSSPAHGGKPGSSWNYSRQVLEATFNNEFSMSAGDEDNFNLSVSGDCAEGSISVAIIMPDGKQLSEVMLDENGSLNWRKSFETGENNNWKNGKWVFRIKAKDATGNLHISMTSY
jgi:hypothetical protein